MTCVATGCNEQAATTRLCSRHEARLAAGWGLPTVLDPLLGAPSGHSIYGRLEADERGVICHECGAKRFQLVLHLRLTHQMDPDDYRRRHGLIPNQPLTPDVPITTRTCQDCGGPASIRATRCAACHAATRPPTPTPRPRWRDLTPTEREELRTGHDLEHTIARLQTDRVPSRTIGTIIGLTPQQMTRHYPRPDWPHPDK